MADTDPILVKKHMIVPFLKDGSTYVQIKKATEFTRSMGAITEDREYISDESATTEVTGYKPSESLQITTYKNEPDFDLFYKLYKGRAIGADAKREFLLVYKFESTEVSDVTYFEAEKTEATIVVNEFNASGSSLSITVNENGTPTRGYVKFVDGAPVFVDSLPGD